MHYGKNKKKTLCSYVHTVNIEMIRVYRLKTSQLMIRVYRLKTSQLMIRVYRLKTSQPPI